MLQVSGTTDFWKFRYIYIYIYDSEKKTVVILPKERLYFPDQEG